MTHQRHRVGQLCGGFDRSFIAYRYCKVIQNARHLTERRRTNRFHHFGDHCNGNQRRQTANNNRETDQVKRLTVNRWTAATGLFAMLAVVALPARAEVSFTLRTAEYFDNTIQRQSAVNFNTPAAAAQVANVAALARQLGATLVTEPAVNARNSTQIAFPQFGGTLTFGWRGSDSTLIALTGLYGHSTGSATQLVQEYFDYTLAGVTVRDVLETRNIGKGDFTRLDLEASMQHRLNETFSLIAGVRAERTTSDLNDTITNVLSTNFFNLVEQLAGLPPIVLTSSPPDIARETYSTWTYSARVGAAAYATVGERHVFYVNGLLQLSYAPDYPHSFVSSTTGTARYDKLRGETDMGPDISVGYMYRMSDRFGIDLRYRATVYFPVSGASNFKDARVNHGVNLGFTTWLGAR
jgi:hypothetical protein